MEEKSLGETRKLLWLTNEQCDYDSDCFENYIIISIVIILGVNGP